VDVVITYNFDQNVAGTSAGDFMKLLKARLGLKHLLTGYDFALGKGREGNPARLAQIGRDLDYSVEVVEAVGDESGVISSTAIRKLIAVGNVAEAARLLGRPYAMSGPIIHGDGRGKSIGVPTANIDVPAEKALPANGIYACYALLDGRRLLAATNVGVRPTFAGGNPEPRVEAYILDFDGDIYGRTLTLEFIQRLRDEEKFDSVEALVDQMKVDIGNARAILNQTPR